MIECKDVKFNTEPDGNQINVTTTVTLTEEDAMNYMELDELLRKPEVASNHDVSDLLSDWGWSFCDDVLSTRNWDTLTDILVDVKHILAGETV